MKITIQGDSLSSYHTGKRDIIFDDEQITVSNRITLTVDGTSVHVLIDDLMPAIIAFDAKRSRSKSEFQ